eukprot:158029_1
MKQVITLLTVLFFSVAAHDDSSNQTWFKNHAGSICDPEVSYPDERYDKIYGRFNSLIDGLEVNCPLVMDSDPTPWGFNASVRLRNNSDQKKYVVCFLTVCDEDGDVVDSDMKLAIGLDANTNTWEDFFVNLDPARRVQIGDILLLYCRLAENTSIQSIQTSG